MPLYKETIKQREGLNTRVQTINRNIWVQTIDRKNNNEISGDLIFKD